MGGGGWSWVMVVTGLAIPINFDFIIFRSSRPEVFCEKGVLKSFAQESTCDSTSLIAIFFNFNFEIEFFIQEQTLSESWLKLVKNDII